MAFTHEITKRPYVVYGLLSVAIMLPLLLPGFILTLDMVFTPQLRMPEDVTSSYLFRTALYVLNVIVPGQIIQKVLLFGMLVLAGFGMHRLVQILQHTPKNILGAYIAGALYMINPFTYSRFMAGQYSVLLGYALLPFFARAWLEFLTQPTRRRAVIAAGWALAISIVSIHTIGPVFILAGVGIALAAWRSHHDSQKLRSLISLSCLAVGIVIIASSYWLVPVLAGSNSTAEAISRFDATDRQAFATEGRGLVGQVANITRLQGFWVEGQGLYALPQDRMPAWGLLVIVLWSLVLIGGVSMWRNKQRFALAWLAVSALIGTLLATSLFNNWLAGWVPLFAGFREPHKFVGLVALVYAVLAGQGTVHLVKKFKPRLADLSPHVIGTCVILLIVALTPTMFWGFGGQLQPREYPNDWHTVNQILNTDTATFQTVFVPWHLYTQFNFSGRIIAHPAPDFFDQPVIVNDDPEFAGVKPTVADADKQTIGQVLEGAAERDNLGAQLAPLNVKYLILSKDSDAADYTYLSTQKDLQLIHDSETLKLYQNKAIMETP